MIWDTLRDGVPTKYAYSKARHYLPPPIRTRIQDICKYMLIQNNNSIVRSETVVRTSEKHVVSIENLQKRVLKQLEKDVSLSTRVKVREGIWEDMAFLEYVADHVRFTHRELQEGISPEEAKNWGNLEALQPSWALKSAQGPNVEYLPESVIVNALDPMLLPALPDTPRYVIEQMNFLQDKQAEFEPLSNSENRLGPRSKTRPGGTAEPFDLGDGRGIALSTRVFSMETEEDTSGVGQTASGSGICDSCGIYHNDLPTHVPQCYGRCLECNQDAQACIRGAEDPIQCLPCLSKGSKCSGVSTRSNVDPEETEANCPRCWGSFVLSNLANHVSSCKGRCSSCAEANLPCIRLPHDNQQCHNCQNAGQECLSFSHDHLFPEAIPKTCDKCLGPSTSEFHKYECVGQCRPCFDAQIPCIRLARFPAKCDHCKEQGLDCGEFTHEENRRRKKKVSCPLCLRDDVYANHQKTCKGRCQGCVRADMPCVRGRGYGGKCEGCTTAEECGGYNHEDNVQTGTCRTCGREMSTLLLKPHERGCKGKYSHCEEAGAACERQGRSVSEPCKRCVSDGVGDSCDGWWKR